MGKFSKINDILKKYKQNVRRIKIEGGKTIATKLNICLGTLSEELSLLANEALNEDESEYLLKETILINPKVFLITLASGNYFNAFSKILDDLEPEMRKIQERSPDIDYEWLFFIRVMYDFPSLNDYKYYKAMRADMLTNSSTPDINVIRSVIEKYNSEIGELDTSVEKDVHTSRM